MPLNAQILATLEQGGGRIHPRAGSQESVDFQAVRQLVGQAVTALTDTGIGAADKIGIHCTESFDWLIWDLACLTLGAVSVPIASTWRQRLDWFDCRAYVLGGAPLPSGVQHLEPDAFRQQPASTLRCHAFQPADPLTMKFTSGTTSKPKSYLASHGHVEHMVRGIQTLFRLNAGDRLLVSMPMNVFLQRILAYTAILACADLAFCAPQGILLAAKKFRPTIVMGPPHLFASIRDLHRRQLALGAATPFSELWGGQARCLWTGSAPICADLLEFYEEHGLPLYEGYGTTETGMIAKNAPGAYRRGTVGKPFPGVEVTLSPQGEVLVRAPHLPAIATSRDGWHATGDIGSLDEDGYLRLSGRLDDQIVLTNGKKLMPSPLEDALKNCQAIRHACIYGENRPYPVAIVEVNGEAAAIRHQIEAAVEALNLDLEDNARLNGFQVLPQGEFERRQCLSELGKLKRKQVAQSFCAEIDALYRERPTTHVA